MLAFEDLAVTYRLAAGEVPAVRGVSLKVAAGEAVGVAGESGSGKSTLAMSVLRLLPRDARVTGRILLDGKDVLAMSWGQLRAVRWAGASIIFQGAQHGLNPVRRIGDQIAEPLLVHNLATAAEARVRVTELLAQVGLPSWRIRSYPHELSGGQRQRVMIAMALACSPKLIIADEPTTALDVMVQAQVLTLIRELIASSGIALLMISHDLSVLADVCDRLAVMYAGRLAETGPSSDVYRAAYHPYSKALAAAFPAVGDPASRLAPRGLGGDPPDPMDLPSGCAFHPRCPVAIDDCSTLDIKLRPATPTHSAACIHVPVTAASDDTAPPPDDDVQTSPDNPPSAADDVPPRRGDVQASPDDAPATTDDMPARAADGDVPANADAGDAAGDKVEEAT